MWSGTKHTGGSMLPRGIGCGATRAAGAAGAVSAQNQPIMKNRVEEELWLRKPEASKGI